MITMIICLQEKKYQLHVKLQVLHSNPVVYGIIYIIIFSAFIWST